MTPKRSHKLRHAVHGEQKRPKHAPSPWTPQDDRVIEYLMGDTYDPLAYAAAIPACAVVNQNQSTDLPYTWRGEG